MSLPQQSTLTAARGALQEGDAEHAYELARSLATVLGLYPRAGDVGSGGDDG
jgi:hypothetical protein